MNEEFINRAMITDALVTLSNPDEYQGTLSSYLKEALFSKSNNYSVAHLLTYCKEMGIGVMVSDTNTEDVFDISSLDELHDVIMMLMKRWNITYAKLREHGITYSSHLKTDDGPAPLSVDTLSKLGNLFRFTLLFCITKK